MKVPDVVGKTLDEAKKELNEAGLGWKIGKQEESAKYEKGLVMSQDPADGEMVKKNTQITLDVSTGRPTRRWPCPTWSARTRPSPEGTGGRGIQGRV